MLLPPVPQQLPPCPGPAPSLMEAHTAQLTAKLPSQDQTWGLGGNRLRQPVSARERGSLSGDLICPHRLGGWAKLGVGSSMRGFRVRVVYCES